MNLDQDLAGMAKAVADARKMLETMPFIVTGAGAGNGRRGLAYSIGLSNFGHPEIFLVDFEFEMSRQLITNAGNLIKEHGADFSGPCLAKRIAEGYVVAFRPIQRASGMKRGGFGRAILGREFDSVQMYLPDANGVFPWSRKVDRQFGKLQMGEFKHDGELPTRLTMEH